MGENRRTKARRVIELLGEMKVREIREAAQTLWAQAPDETAILLEALKEGPAPEEAIHE